jgi:probable HAF family extracellular repeat protein
MGFRVSVVVWVVPTTSFRKPYSHSPTAKIFGEGIAKVNIYRTLNAWRTYPPQDISFRSTVTGDVVAGFSPLLVLPSDTTALYAATRVLWRYDPTASPPWTKTPGNKLLAGNNNYVLSLASGCAGNTLYTGSLDGFVFRTPDAGATWTTAGSPLLGLPVLAVTAISVDPGNANSILVGFGGNGASHLWQCLDTSVAAPVWTNVSAPGAGIASLPDVQLNAIVRDPGDPEHTWYVGTDIGVFQTLNAGQSWGDANQPLGLPNMQVNDLKVAPGTGYLYAASFGRGIWRLNLSGQGNYNVIDLDRAGDRESRALAINHSMQIAGFLLTSAANTFGNLWTTPQTSMSWGTLPGGSNSYATAIDTAGDVVGYADDSNGTDHAVIQFAGSSTLHNLEFENQALISQANGLNDSGIVVGQHSQTAFVYRLSTQGFIDMKTLGGASSEATAINNAPKPQVVGWSMTATGGPHAFLHNGIAPPLTAKDDLGTLGGAISEATAVNDLGEVVGFSTTASGQTHAFKTSPNAGIKPVKSDLGTLGGPISYAYAISENGLVVGSSYTASGDLHAFIWSAANGMQDLNNLISAGSGWTLVSAQGICDCGCIVGYGFVNGHTHAFLLQL